MGPLTLSGDCPMALRATVYKIELQVNDLDRGVFAAYPLSLACHPSETEERLMVRLLAFALHADESLTFGRGIANEDEATLWRHDLTGVTRLWVEVGLPDERLLRRACGRADDVVLYTYGGRSAALWWSQNQEALVRCRNLRVVDLDSASTQALAALAQRNVGIQVTIQEGTVWVSAGADPLEIHPRVLVAGTLS